MKIIYRVYEIEDTANTTSWWGDAKNIIAQEVCFCNSKEEFKEIMQFQWGNIPLRHVKGMKPGDRFISIISYDAYDVESYITVEEHVCAHCGKTYLVNPRRNYQLEQWDLDRLEKICQPLYLDQKEELLSVHFCSRAHKTAYYDQKQTEYEQYAKEHDLLQDFWVDRGQFTGYGKGYIYMITKRSTGEFYVGQSKYVPMFRWMQHLKTERFDQKYIQDYIYEILEVVDYQDNLLDRETYWINKKYNENPDKSLNISRPDAEKVAKRRSKTKKVEL